MESKSWCEIIVLKLSGTQWILYIRKLNTNIYTVNFLLQINLKEFHNTFPKITMLISKAGFNAVSDNKNNQTHVW